MPDYDIGEELSGDIEDIMGEYTGSGAIGTAELDPDTMAYLGTSPANIARMFEDLGITDAGSYAQFLDTYDPWKEQVARDEYSLGRREGQAATKEDLMGKVGKPIDLTAAGMTGFEGIGGGGGYQDMLENLDTSGAAGKFSRMMEGLGIDKAKAIQASQSDWTEQFYDTATDIYAQQNQPSSGGGGSCFYKNSKVLLENGSIKKVYQIQPRDKVQAIDDSGNIIFSEVLKPKFRLFKRDNKADYYYTIIKAGDVKLKVTARHRMYVNGLNKTIKAKKIYPGMEINIVKDGILQSVKVDTIEHKMLKGKYDIFTKCGNVIVDNVLCTIFDGPLPHKLALWGWRMSNKFRWFYNLNIKWYKPLYRFTMGSDPA